MDTPNCPWCNPACRGKAVSHTMCAKCLERLYPEDDHVDAGPSIRVSALLAGGEALPAAGPVPSA